MTQPSNHSTYPFEQGQNMANRDINRLLKARKKEAYDSGNPDMFWEGYMEAFYDWIVLEINKQIPE
jgi:hypothetical protein